MKNVFKKTFVSILAFCLVFTGIVPSMPVVQAAEIKGGLFDPHTGKLEITFGYQQTQYVNINVYVRSKKGDGAAREYVGKLAENVLLSGAQDLAYHRPEAEPDTMQEAYTPVTKIDERSVRLKEGEIYQTEESFAGDPIEPTDMREHTLIWDGSIDGIPIIGPDLDEDEFYLTIEIEPLGRPDLNEPCVDEDDGEGGSIHSHGKNYTWTQDKNPDGSKKYAVSVELLVDYRNYVIDEDGTAAFLMLEGSLSDMVREQLYEQFFSGSMICSDITEHPDLEGIVLDHNDLDPVDMVTGAFGFMYNDLRLESTIPLTFMRVYNSRYEKGSLGKGFTHSYDYSLVNDRGIIRVTMPGGEEQIFLTLRSGGYDPLSNSGFIMKDDPDGYCMEHEDGARFYFTREGKLDRILNPDATVVAKLTYTGNDLTRIQGVPGDLDLSWKDGHIVKVKDSAGRESLYSYEGDLLTSVTNPDEDTLQYTYDTNGHIKDLYDFEGERYLTNEYDEYGRVTSQIVYNAGTSSEATVVYDDENLITTCTDEKGLVKKYYYDNHRNILGIGRIIDGTEYITENAYTEDYRANALTEVDGTKVGYVYDGNGNVTESHFADGGVYHYTYTDNGEIAMARDPLGNTESYVYSSHSLTAHTDKNGNQITFTYGSFGLPESRTDALGSTWLYEYDEKARLVKVTDPEGGENLFSYDAAGRKTSEKTKVREGIYAESTSEYSDAGKLLKETDALGNTTQYTSNANGFVTKTKDALGGETITEYGTNAQPLKEVDADGNTTTYTYWEDTGLLKSVADPEGGETVYEYDERGLLTKSTGPKGEETLYEYDVMDRLVKETDAMGGETTYTYDAMGRKALETDAEGNPTKTAYDLLGRVVSVTDAEGNSTSYTYDAAGYQTSETDGNGNVRRTEYDAAGNPVKTIDGEGNATVSTYDRMGRLLTETDPLGNTTSYTYDLAGNQISVKDPRGNTTRYQYDLLGRNIEVIYPDGSSEKTFYDALGRTVKTVDERGGETLCTYSAYGDPLTQTDPLGNTTKCSYDGNHKVVSIRYPDGGTTSNVYDASGNVVSVTDALGNETTYGYDLLGRVIKVTDPEGKVTESVYDKAGNILSCSVDGHEVQRAEYDRIYRIVSDTNGLGDTAYYEYDGATNLIRYTDRNGCSATYEYNKNGALIRAADPEGGVMVKTYDAAGNVISSTDPEENTTRYTYDENHNLLTTVDAMGGVVSCAYDQRNRKTLEKNELGAETSYEYDRAGNLIREIDAKGNTASYEYDLKGNLTKEVNRMNEKTLFEYDCMDRQVKMTNALNHRTKAEYDLNGNRVSETDENGHTTFFEYDKAGRLLSETDPEGGQIGYTYNYLDMISELAVFGGGNDKAVTKYAYDGAGNLLRETSPLGYETSYLYDKEGNVLTVTNENGQVTKNSYDKMGRKVSEINEDDTTTYRYDKAGNMTEAANSFGSVGFGYDAVYHVIKVNNEDGSDTAYEYDAAGNRLSITYPDGKTVTMAYDELGNVSSLTDHDGTGIRYTRDAEGRVIKEAHSDGSSTEYDYNAEGLLTLQKEVTKKNRTLRQTAYTYDDAGNLTSENRSGVDIDRKDEVVRYTYDKADRLIKDKTEGKTTAYRYDLAGNLLSDGEYTYTYDLQNRLTQKFGKEGETSYSYDSAGNLTKETSPEGFVVYGYDARGRLIKGEKSDGESSEYRYDAMGARVYNQQIRKNENERYQNQKLDGGSRGRDYTAFLKDGRAAWQRNWETEVGTVVQNDHETVTRHYVTDYLSPANRDILVTEDGSYVTRYVYDGEGSRLSAEFSYADGTERGTLNGKGEAGENPQSDLAAKDNQKVWYRTSDQDSTLFAVDKKGDTIAHMIYDPWGRPLLKTYTDSNYSGLENLNNFTGYTWDETLRLYFAQNRFYDPGNHRFTQEDPVKDGWNWYAYCENDPMNSTDPSGTLRVPRVVTSAFTVVVKGKRRIIPKGAIVQYELGRKSNGYAYVYYDPYGYAGDVYTGYLRYPTIGEMTGEIIRSRTFVTVTQNGGIQDMFYAAGFIRTSDGVYHARQDALQRFGGYNSVYDSVFNYVTDMRKEFYEFKYNNMFYRFWVWKGDYLNLGAGAELGIYKKLYNSSHWLAATNLNLFMGVTLWYDYRKRGQTKFFDYYPSGTHWWITGFNPYQQRVQACRLTAEYSVTFTNQKGMYWAFKKEMKLRSKPWRFIDSSFNAKLFF